MTRDLRAFALLAVTTLVSACSDSSAGPEAPSTLPGAPNASAVKFWDANAAANWNEQATSLAARQPVNVSRLYVYLSLAQLRAAEDAETIRPHPPTSSAIGAASAAVLSAYFPAFTAEIEAALDAQEAADPWPGAKHQDAVAGEAIGRAAAARVIAYSASDLVGLTDPGVPPIGPGYWVWNGGPIARGNLGARPFFLSSGNEFRPPPPPASSSRPSS